MAEKTEQLSGKIRFTNLTKALGEGETPDSEFLYAIVDHVPALGSEVYIHRRNIKAENYADFKDGVEVIFTPERESEERLSAARGADKPIRPYFGTNVRLARQGDRIPIPEEQPVVATPEATADEKKQEAPAQTPEPVQKSATEQTEKKPQYDISITARDPHHVIVQGTLNGKPTPMTYAINATTRGRDNVRFSVICDDGEEFKFKKSHQGLEVDDGILELNVKYRKKSVALSVRSIEANKEVYKTLWK